MSDFDLLFKIAGTCVLFAVWATGAIFTGMLMARLILKLWKL